MPPRGRSARLTGVDAVGVSPLQDVWSVSKSLLGHIDRLLTSAFASSLLCSDANPLVMGVGAHFSRGHAH